MLEPPETPAPVFAMRAFKSALFGTPGAEEEETEKGKEKEKENEKDREPQSKPTAHQRSKSETTKPMSILH